MCFEDILKRSGRGLPNLAALIALCLLKRNNRPDVAQQAQGLSRSATNRTVSISKELDQGIDYFSAADAPKNAGDVLAEEIVPVV